MTDFISVEDDWELPYRQCMEAGIKVIALNKINANGSCGCGDPECKTIGKHPVAGNWQHTPMWSDEQVATMREFMGQLYPAYGALVDNGLLIVDCDERNGGHESVERMKRDGLDLYKESLFIVRSGSGGRSCHFYFRCESIIGKKLYQSVPQYPGIDFKSSGFVVGWGSPHASGLEYEREKGFPDDIGKPPAALIDLIEHKGTYTGVSSGVLTEVTDDELRSIASYINVSGMDYHGWAEVGMALHHTTGGADLGLELWDQISSTTDPERYGVGVCHRKWHTFGKSTVNVTLGTLIHLARSNGYVESVTFDAGDEFAEFLEDATPDQVTEKAENLSISKLAAGINLRDLPGYAGKVAEWINNCSRYPRENLAVGAALYALSCIGGMRHIDERDGMPLNIMVFNVAGTGTGKESIGQSVTELLIRAGVVAAQHGKFKSEQEIMRNLTRHQAAFYSVDEIGIELRKIKNAAKSGGASYLVAIIGFIMSVYSKADGVLPITGDDKETLKDAIKSELQRINKQLDSHLDDTLRSGMERQAERLTESLTDVDEGIKNPYFCLFGSTTPQTFDESIDAETAQNGFVARSIIIRETETNPRAKRNFKPTKMHDMMAARLSQLYNGGETVDRNDDRVMSRGNVKSITTDREADKLLNEASDYFWLMGEREKDKTGLEGITRRSYEIAAKVSLILAMADGGVRTAEHVLYGFAFAKADTELKIEYAYSSMNEDAIDSDLKGNAKLVKLMSKLSYDTPVTRGQVNKMMRCSTAAEVAIYITKLEEFGKISITSSMSANNRLTDYIVRV